MTLKILFEFCILKKMHITHKKFKKPRLHKIKKKKNMAEVLWNCISIKTIKDNKISVFVQ